MPNDRTRGRAPKRRQRRRFTAGTLLMTMLAELLLGAGALLGLYVVWETFWTDYVGTKQAVAAVDELRENPQFGPEVAGIGTPRTDEPPLDPAYAKPRHKDMLGVLHVPRWGLDYARGVYEGTDKPGVLNPLGIGHYTGTVGPGEVGNFALAGHRTTYSKPFWGLGELQVGDQVVYESAEVWYVYRLTEVNKIIWPSQNEVLAPVYGDRTWTQVPTERTITLTACHPKFSLRQRIVVHGVFEYWVPKAEGLPPALAGA